VIKPVGQFRANPFGLHDVHGNVLEWCRDAPWGSVHSVEGEHEETGTLSRVMCGGSYDTAPSMARSGWHLAFDTDSRDNRNGLRVARGVMP
jgi:formylglycine-generating enzyme required for sulfatase activity